MPSSFLLVIMRVNTIQLAFGLTAALREGMNKSQGKVLIIDDEIAVRRALESVLRGLGFEVSSVAKGEDALTLIRTFRYDAVLLDIAMPGIGGIQTCKELRKLRPHLGILMITVHDSEEMTIQALDAGADDYLIKPFNMRELAARLRALIRRSRVSEARTDCVITAGEIELDPARRTVKKSGEPVHLTPKEFDLLFYLMSHAGFPITHARLLAAVWGPNYGQEVEYLRTFVRQLRKKLGDDAVAPKYLLTVSHVGYCFRAQPESSGEAPKSLALLDVDFPGL
jgi:two-component system, OmpR family, KDP operon response regulator KdpE